MRYTRFSITNFKGIASLSLDLARHPRGNVFPLIGLNESGKTSVLQALHWYSDTSAYDSYDLIPKAQRANFNGEISVEAHLELTSDDQREAQRFFETQGHVLTSQIPTLTVRKVFFYKNSAKYRSFNYWSVWPSVRKKQGKVVRKLSGKDNLWQAFIKYLGENLVPPIVFYENFLFDFPDEIYLAKLESFREFEQNTYRLVLQDVLDSLDLGLTIKDHLITRYERGNANDMDGIQAVLDQASAKITEVVVSAWRDIVKQPVKDLAITLGTSISRDDEGLFLRLKVKEGSQTYYIRERSLGFRWFLGFILFTHFRTYRDNQKRNALFLLDEPASNLHPAAQGKILSVFDSFPKNQLVLYSTHSHHMIRPEWLHSTYVVLNSGRKYDGLDLSFTAGMTKIEIERYFPYVAKHPNDRDLFRPILEALDYQPGPLEMVPDIIVVEGKNDYYTLRFAAEVLKLGTGSYHFYPSTGKDKTDFVVSLYMAWGRNFIVLLDGDKGGRETTARLRKTYGSEVDDRVFTLADINPSWKDKELEDLFDERERVRIQKTIFPSEKEYSKSAFNSALQALYLQRTDYSVSDSAQKRLKQVLDFASDRLLRAKEKQKGS